LPILRLAVVWADRGELRFWIQSDHGPDVLT
jgi:hypothetical protein